MSAAEALKIYRCKDAVEKLIHSLKSEIEAKPLRVVGGRRVRRPPHGFHRSNDHKFDTIFRKASETHVNEVHHVLVQKLTVKVVSVGIKFKKRFCSIFDAVNRAILSGHIAET